jgi:hypothetical protein
MFIAEYELCPLYMRTAVGNVKVQCFIVTEIFNRIVLRHGTHVIALQDMNKAAV